MNQFNALHGDEQNEPLRECNSQPTEDNFKYRISPSKTNPAISARMWRLNHHAIDNGGVKVPTSDFPVDFNYASVPDPYTTPIKSTDYD